MWSHVIQALIVAEEIDLADRLATALVSQTCMQDTSILSNIVSAWKYKNNLHRARQIVAIFNNYGIKPRQSLATYVDDYKAS